MPNWKEYKLGEITKWKSGGTPSKQNELYWNGNIPWISAKTFKSSRIFDSEIKITKEGLENGSRLAEINSILLLVRGSGLFNGIPIGIVKAPVAFNQDIKAIEVDKEVISAEYLFYWLMANRPLLESKIEHTGIGAGKFETEIIKELKLSLPSIRNQISIAEIFSSLDDKIELNNQINQELEALAQALFKQWFIDFELPNENGQPYKSSGGEMVESELGEIPKGWKVSTIYDIAEVIYGAPFKSSLFNQSGEGLPLIRIRDLKTNEPQYWTNEKHPKGTVIQAGDLIVGMDAEFRPHFWLGSDAWLNQRLCTFKPKAPYSRLFVREVIRPQLQFFENSSVGTTVIHLGKGDIDTFKSISPNVEISNKFSNLSESVVESIINSAIENRELRKIRDTLLPKLISGELTVKDI